MKKVVIPRDREIIQEIREILEEENEIWLFIDEQLLEIEKAKAGFYMTGFDGTVRLAYDGHAIAVQYVRNQMWHHIISVECDGLIFSNVKDPKEVFFITTE